MSENQPPLVPPNEDHNYIDDPARKIPPPDGGGDLGVSPDNNPPGNGGAGEKLEEDKENLQKVA